MNCLELLKKFQNALNIASTNLSIVENKLINRGKGYFELIYDLKPYKNELVGLEFQVEDKLRSHYNVNEKIKILKDAPGNDKIISETLKEMLLILGKDIQVLHGINEEIKRCSDIDFNLNLLRETFTRVRDEVNKDGYWKKSVPVKELSEAPIMTDTFRKEVDSIGITNQDILGDVPIWLDKNYKQVLTNKVKEHFSQYGFKEVKEFNKYLKKNHLEESDESTYLLSFTDGSAVGDFNSNLLHFGVIYSTLMDMSNPDFPEVYDYYIKIDFGTGNEVHLVSMDPKAEGLDSNYNPDTSLRIIFKDTSVVNVVSKDHMDWHDYTLSRGDRGREGIAQSFMTAYGKKINNSFTIEPDLLGNLLKMVLGS